MNKLKKWLKTTNRGVLVLGCIVLIGLIVFKVKDMMFQNQTDAIEQVIHEYIEAVWDLNLATEDQKKPGYTRTKAERDAYKEKAHALVDRYWSADMQSKFGGTVNVGYDNKKFLLNHFLTDIVADEALDDALRGGGVVLKKDYDFGEIVFDRIASDIVRVSFQYVPYWSVSQRTFLFDGFNVSLQEPLSDEPDAESNLSQRSQILALSSMTLDMVYEDGTWKIIQIAYEEDLF